MPDTGDKECDFVYSSDPDYGFYPARCRTHDITFPLGVDPTEDDCINQRKLELRIKLRSLTTKDLQGIISIAIARNYGGFNSSMLDEPKENMIDYLNELDVDELEQIYYRWVED